MWVTGQRADWLRLVAHLPALSWRVEDQLRQTHRRTGRVVFWFWPEDAQMIETVACEAGARTIRLCQGWGP